MTKPTRYFLEYEDDDLNAKALARAGGNPDGVDPADIYAIHDVETIEEAKAVAPTLPCSIKSAAIRERKDLQYELLDGIIPWWEWDEETVEEIQW